MRIFRTYTPVLSALFLIVTLNGPAAADGAYLCIADMATGFSLDQSTKQWQVTRFDISKSRYVVKYNENGATWNEFGSPLPPVQCSAFDRFGYIACPPSGGVQQVTFNRMNLKYQLIQLAGWIGSDLPPPDKRLASLWNSFQTKPDTPLIEIGRCSAL